MNTIQDLPHLTELIEQTSIWKPASIIQEPETRLTQWRVFRVEANEKNPATIHFVGYAGYEGRVCSAVQEFDKNTMRGITKSGRIYELCGSSGYNSDAMYVWGRWLTIYGNPEYSDITATYKITNKGDNNDSN